MITPLTQLLNKTETKFLMKNKNSSLTLLLLSFAFLINSALADSGITVDSDERVHGFLQSTYVNMWWQWAVSMPKEDSPVKDTVGTKCGVNQAGPVWFLAGGYGTSRIRRKCSVPADKYIFFPVINMLNFPRDERSIPTCESVKRGASINNQYLVSFKVIVDDQKFLNPVFYRQTSEKCFDLAARKPNTGEYPRAYPSATDGYWIMLRPLSAGNHNISFYAEYNNPGSPYGRSVQDIGYELNVYEP